MTVQVEIVVPQVGEAVSEVVLVEWLKEEGSRVGKGEPLFEIDTDKAVVTVEAFADGTLAQILVPAGSAVMPRQVVGILEQADKQGVLSEAPLRHNEAAQSARATPRISPMARRVADDLGVDPRAARGTGPGGRVTAQDVRRLAGQGAERSAMPSGASRSAVRANVSPKARRLARELGVDLAGLAGTGVGGMITTKDVRSAAEAVARSTPTAPARPEADVRPLTKLRRTIATRMVASKQTIPHFYLLVDVDMSQVQRLRGYCSETLGWERSPSYTDVIVRACALALAAMPQSNVIFAEQGVIQRKTVDIGVAVTVDNTHPSGTGLIVPVLPQADRLGLRATSRQLRALAERARRGRLRESDLGPKSMVVSNLGMYGVDAFVAIIDPPDPMILAVGRVADRVVPVAGQPAIRPMCTLALSADHRVLDGTQGAQFLARVKIALENPFEMLGASEGEPDA
jgi:pyruvate dehydrogenase E2 component (dihydrolipoamide acetyltransferase)